ncbi:Lrp/AsnC family transcriptional regulator [Vibrio penaeicida]|uniref:AsnC family transcriptional regulator n=1 Tax=Vibrio penaeicida TaxID=104609 RepID=A0AAV5NZF3_9VIBR|nr:Lrp/AsnC family transcriptional regulator [Vibrio penaeicida]RTZ21916.1 Lrp/AsnC family transcriptional regulator [Vibrio penaeicida]GLQ75738.1 AsnC family transcriptional regulator [Vibrio penaeicida]
MFLDKLDKAILRRLQEDSSVTNVELSESVGLSAPACFKRVKRLKEEGVISKEVALINHQKLGPMIHMVVEVIMERDRLELNRAFIDKVNKSMAVKECYKVTGEVDFVLIVDSPTMESYESLCDELLYSNPNVKNFRTLISMNKVKYDTRIQIFD